MDIPLADAGIIGAVSSLLALGANWVLSLRGQKKDLAGVPQIEWAPIVAEWQSVAKQYKDQVADIERRHGENIAAVERRYNGRIDELEKEIAELRGEIDTVRVAEQEACAKRTEKLFEEFRVLIAKSRQAQRGSRPSDPSLTEQDSDDAEEDVG